MSKKLFLLLFLLLYTQLIALKLSNETSYVNLTPDVSILYEINSSYGFDETKEFYASNKFKKENLSSIALGYKYIGIWLQFELENDSDISKTMILELDDPLQEDVVLYNNTNTPKLLYEQNHNFIKNTLKLKIAPMSKVTYFLHIKTGVASLNVKLGLWEEAAYNKYATTHIQILSLFFGAMIALILYNLSLFFFTRDSLYIYYVFYAISMTMHHVLITTYGHYIKLSIFSGTLLISLMVISIALFTQRFLELHKFPRLNKIIFFFIYLCILYTVLGYFNINVLSAIMTTGILTGIYGLVIGYYLLYKGVPQARYYVAGWTIMIATLILLALRNISVTTIFDNFSYLLEFAIFAEALIFSIALAARITQLRKEKAEADSKLIISQQKEKELLKTEIKKATLSLQEKVQEKTLLLHELNHRVKNNLQFIIAILEIQSAKSGNNALSKEYEETINRLLSLSGLHTLLYNNDNLSEFNVNSYFKNIVQHLVDASGNKKQITVNIKGNVLLSIDKLLYCGLIVNELATNSLKYAFDSESKGDISINIYTKESKVILEVSDSGDGYNSDEATSDSFGLFLVNILVYDQLKGKLIYDGTKKNIHRIVFDAS